MAIRERHEKLSAAQAHRIRHHLNEILHSKAYSGSKRSQALLLSLVEDALAGRFDDLHERSIGVRLYGRAPNYDTANDAIVRVNVTEVRKRLAQFYRELDAEPSMCIELPSGSYVPRFVFGDPRKAAAALVAVKTEQPALESEARLATVPETAPQAAAPGTESGPAALSPVSLTVSENTFRHRRLLWALAALALVAIAGGAAWFQTHRSRPPAVAGPSSQTSILVLPMENLSGDSGQDFLADGMTDELIADLGQVSALRTISRTSAMSFKKTRQTLPEIARELGVQWVVEGAVVRQKDRVRVTVQLIDPATDHSVWSNSFIRSVSDTLKLEGELALAIAQAIRVEVTPNTRERFDQAQPVNEAAQQTYLQGMVLLQSSTASINSEQAHNINQAILLFQRAAALDTGFAQPHAMLAESYSRLVECGAMAYAKAYPLQKAEALKAIELQPSLAEGHAELASAAIDLDYGWATAEAEFKKALDLNPGSVPIRLRYALFLVKMGRTDEAVAQAELCRKLDPLSARLVLEAEYIYFYSRKYDQALALDRDGLARGIVADRNNHLFGMVDLAHGQFADAVKELKPSQFPTGIGRLGVAYARSGQMAGAEAAIRTLKATVEKTGVGAYETSLVYAALGDKENAFHWLERSFELHDKGVTYVRIDPALDPLRADPRFAAVLRQAGFGS